MNRIIDSRMIECNAYGNEKKKKKKQMFNHMIMT